MFQLYSFIVGLLLIGMTVSIPPTMAPSHEEESHVDMNPIIVLAVGTVVCIFIYYNFPTPKEETSTSDPIK